MDEHLLGGGESDDLLLLKGSTSPSGFKGVCKKLCGMVTMDGATLFALVASIGNLLQGWDSASIAGAIFYIKEEFNLESMPMMEGFIMAMVLLGAAISTLLSGRYADAFGRHPMLLISSILSVISGLLIIVLSHNVYLLIIQRFISGLSIGLAVTYVPLYISEIAPTEIRGKLNTFPQLTGSVGMFISYCVVFSMSLMPNFSWRIMIGVQLIPSFFYAMLIIFYLPESPRWLVSKGKTEKAKIVLQRIQRRQDVSDEMANLLEGIGDEHTPSRKDHEEQFKMYGLDKDLPCIAYQMKDENIQQLCSVVSSIFDPIVSLTGSFYQKNITHIDPGYKSTTSSTTTHSTTHSWDDLENQYDDEGEEGEREREGEGETKEEGKDEDGSEMIGSGLHIGGGWQLAWKFGGEEGEDERMQGVYVHQGPEQQPSSPITEQQPLSYILEPGVKKALILGITIQALQQFAGINGMLYYTPQILEQVGVGGFLSQFGLGCSSTSILLSALTTLVMLPCIVIASQLMDKSGRRRLLLVTIPMLLTSLVILVVVNIVNLSNNLHAIISTFCVLVYLCIFVTGFGPIPNILCAEIFPTRVRAICLVICSMTFWICDIIVTYTFPVLMRSIGLAGVFGICAFVCALALLFVYLKVAESKGVPLEVMSEYYAPEDLKEDK